MTLGNILSMLSESGVLNNAQKPQSSGGDVMDLVGSLLGGGQSAPAGGQAQSPGVDVGDILGSLLGGAQPAAQSGETAAAGGQDAPDGMLNMILSVMQSPAGSSLIQPIVNQVADKVGIPPETALIAVTFVIRYLATNHGAKITRGEDLSGILQEHSDAGYVQANDVSAQLAKQTGLDSQTAAAAMAEVFKLLGVNQ